MTWPRTGDRDRGEVEALAVDRYLDALLAAADRRAADAPADALLDPELRDAARALRRALVRLHPSFRFEERLARRLADAAAAQARGEEPGLVLALPGVVAGADDAAVLVALPLSDAAALPGAAAGPVPRQLIVGGAMASAAISLVGVAWVAWRASRPGRSLRLALPAATPMARAARTVRGRRRDQGIRELAARVTGGPA